MCAFGFWRRTVEIIRIFFLVLLGVRLLSSQETIITLFFHSLKSHEDNVMKRKYMEI